MGCGCFPDMTVVQRWNDAPGRAKEDVLALYDKAIAGLEEL